MSQVGFNELLLDSVGVGLAIVAPDDLRVVFHNRRFGEWFAEAVAGPVTLPELVPSLDRERLRARLARGSAYRFESDVVVGRRPLAVAGEITGYDGPAGTLLVLECQNVSRLKELEYMIESYSRMIEKQTRTLEREKERAEKLLLNIMPRKVYEEIRAFGVTTPQRFEAASILMLDFVGFTEMAADRDPAPLVAELNDVFTAFDRIVEQFGCERIKTVGDAYMAVSGVPEPTPDHAQNIAKAALLMVRYLERRNRTRDVPWLCRVGVNSGTVIGSIVGVHKYVYDIFGPAVNLTSRLEALSDPMGITVGEDMAGLIADDFHLDDRGEVDIRGIGLRRVYSLVGEAALTRPGPPAPPSRPRPAPPSPPRPAVTDPRAAIG